MPIAAQDTPEAAATEEIPETPGLRRLVADIEPETYLDLLKEASERSVVEGTRISIAQIVRERLMPKAA